MTFWESPPSWVSIAALMVSLLALSLTIRRDILNRPRIKVASLIHSREIDIEALEFQWEITIEISNIGQRATTVKMVKWQTQDSVTGQPRSYFPRKAATEPFRLEPLDVEKRVIRIDQDESALDDAIGRPVVLTVPEQQSWSALRFTRNSGEKPHYGKPQRMRIGSDV